MAEMTPILWGALFAVHSRHRSGIGGDRARIAVGCVGPLDGWMDGGGGHGGIQIGGGSGERR